MRSGLALRPILYILHTLFDNKQIMYYCLYINMPDNLLLIIFGILSTISLFIGGIAIHLAMKNARKNDGELWMAFWAVIALAGLTFSGMCWAYFLIPIITNRIF